MVLRVAAGGIPTSGPGSGDVVGPASSVDNTLPRFDGTTGKLLQTSGIVVDDSNNVSAVGTLGSGAITASGQFLSTLASGGSAGTPAFAPAAGQGMYGSGGTLQFSTSNTLRLSISTVILAANIPILWTTDAGASIGQTNANRPNNLFLAGKIAIEATVTAGGTTGAQTINKAVGTVNFAASATSLVVTNSLVTTSSIIFAVIRTNDTTATIKNVVPASGSFTITLTAAATAETSVGFMLIEPD